MPYNPDQHHRRSIRLPDYDYAAAGAYFVTLVTYERACLFGNIENGEMRPNVYGQIVEEEWVRAQRVRDGVELDAFVVMPNHVHGIIVLGGGTGVGHPTPPPRATHRVAPTGTGRPAGPAAGSLGAILGQFKSNVTRRINALRGGSGTPIWQRNYYEHVIRDDAALERIRDYIVANPARWPDDRENPNAAGRGDPVGRPRTPETWE